jgi:hypothetical protein
MNDVLNGIIVGATGGTLAGVAITVVNGIISYGRKSIDKRRVYKWLLKGTSNEPGKQYRSTRAIASWNNLTEDRVRYICSIHKKIYLSTGPREDLWSLWEHSDRSIYEKPGIQSV